MTYKIYIQSLNNFPIADWAVSAYLGWKGMGTDIVFFENIDEVPASKWHIVVADIESTNAYFERLGLGPKISLNIPEEIEKYADRQIIRTTMGELRHGAYDVPYMYPIFLKPNGRSKEFIGGVVKDKEMLERHFSKITDNTPILLSEVIDIQTEWRTYVVEGEILGLCNYLGDFMMMPDTRVIREAVKAYKSAPAGYAMDFGVTNWGKTVLIECNDGWSLGNYGLEPSKYCRLLGRRWHELMKPF